MSIDVRTCPTPGVETAIAALQIEGPDTPEDVLAAVLAAKKEPLSKEGWYNLLFDLFDADESGTMEFDEFMPLMKALDESISEKHVQWSFDAAAGGVINAKALSREQFAAWGTSVFAEYTQPECEDQIRDLLRRAAGLATEERERNKFMLAADDGLPDPALLDQQACDHMMWVRFLGINRKAFALCVDYTWSVTQFKRFLLEKMEQQSMNFDLRRLRLFFDDAELLETERLRVGVDSYGKPLYMERSRGVKDYITAEIMRGEKDPTKPAHENTHEIWLYEGKEIDPYDNFMTFMAQHMDNAFKIFKEIDLDGGGSVDKEELRAAMSMLKFDIYVDPHGESEFDKIWAAIDDDGSGELDYTEFVRAVKDHEKAKLAAW